MQMRKNRTSAFSWLLTGTILYLALMATAAIAQPASDPPPQRLSLDDILAGMEKRYSGVGFSARFEQRSILKAMDLVDTASGSILVKRPGKMRWSYETPERQLIITDGVN